MEPIDLIMRGLVLLLALMALVVIALVLVALLRYARRRVPAQPTAPEAPKPTPQRTTRTRRAPTKISWPRLVADAAETPPNKFQINAVAATLERLAEKAPQEEAESWIAATPRVFNAELLAALHPEWAGHKIEIYERLRRLWFVTTVPGGSCVQATVRRAMLQHLFRKDELREDYQRNSLRAAKFFHGRMVAQSDAYTKRNARFVSETFYRFLPPNYSSAAAVIEWLYHLAIGDPMNAQRALDQLGQDWLATRRVAELQNLLDALREHADERRLPDTFVSLVYYYKARLALSFNRAREALADLEHARRMARNDPTLMPRLYDALSVALDVLSPPDRSVPPDGSAWSSLARPTLNRLQLSLWADLILPLPGLDRLRRATETMNIYRVSKNLSGEGMAMRLLGDEHLARGDYRQALAWYERSRDKLQQASVSEGTRGSLLLDEALTFRAIGTAQFLMGRSEEALQSYAEALRRHDPLKGDELNEADTRKARGDALHFLSRYAEAMVDYEKALTAYRKGGAIISSGETLLARGRLLESQQRHEEAWRSYEEALELYRQCGSSIGLANALLVIGSARQLHGNLQSAEQRFAEALKIYRAEKNEAGEAAALKALGDVRLAQKRPDAAEACYAEALTQFKTAGLRRNMAETELAIGRLEEQRRNYEGAAHHSQLALEQFLEIEDRRGAADAQLQLGIARQLQRNSEEALSMFQQALTLYRQLRDRFGEAQTEAYLGEECLLLKRYDDALRNFEVALNLWKEIGDPINAVEVLHGRVGHTLTVLGRDAEAARAFNRAAELRSPSQFGWLGWQALINIQFDDALVHFTAMVKRDPAVSWQIGLALANLTRGYVAEGTTIMTQALDQANTVELGDACRWCEVVARLDATVDLKPEQFGLNC